MTCVCGALIYGDAVPCHCPCGASLAELPGRRGNPRKFCSYKCGHREAVKRAYERSREKKVCRVCGAPAGPRSLSRCDPCHEVDYARRRARILQKRAARPAQIRVRRGSKCVALSPAVCGSPRLSECSGRVLERRCPECHWVARRCEAHGGAKSVYMCAKRHAHDSGHRATDRGFHALSVCLNLPRRPVFRCLACGTKVEDRERRKHLERAHGAIVTETTAAKRFEAA